MEVQVQLNTVLTDCMQKLRHSGVAAQICSALVAAWNRLQVLGVKKTALNRLHHNVR